jgi:2'-5' RNA ligase
MSATSDDRPFTRFFIALLPPAPVQAYATDVIRELSDRYRSRTAKAPPHITLQPPFLWRLESVTDLETCLSAFAQSQPAIPITLSGFGAFAPRVLYINVLKSSELLSVQANLMAQLEETLGIVDSQSKRRSFSPHMTVASRNLTRQTFQQAWTDLQPRPVQFEFVSDRLTLLLHDGQCWQIRAEFPFSQ